MNFEISTICGGVPACSPGKELKGPIVKMMDGNFSQKRYVNSGSHIHAPFFGNIYLDRIPDDGDNALEEPLEGCSF